MLEDRNEEDEEEAELLLLEFVLDARRSGFREGSLSVLWV